MTLRKWLVRLARTCLSLVRRASGLSTYPARPFRWNIAWLIMYPRSVRPPHMSAYRLQDIPRIESVEPNAPNVCQLIATR